MRLHRGVPVLAAVVTLAGSAPAYAFDAGTQGGGIPQTPTALAAHHQSGSTDWLIGVGAASGVALIGAGVAGSRRVTRRTASTRRVGAASGS